ncbi:MAG TPA: DUF5916 domain-containing protein [Chitinophagaceae bacterium]|nr:DUF5916 domain-containing protein [Chitinophagaceae bacterium]
MKISTLIILILFSCQLLLAQSRKICDIISINESPKLDGNLDDEVWKKCKVMKDFTQTIPNPDQPSKFNSEVRMYYTNSTLCIGATLYQPKNLSSRQLTARDLLYNINSDIFAIFFDPYDDHQNGFTFRVSSAGVQHDERLSNGSEYGDESWDAVWLSKVSLHEDRWEVEIEIPFSALRFSKQKEMNWGINFFRSVRKINETSYWNQINVQKQGFLAQTGQINGLKNVTPPIRLFLFPYLSTGYLQQEESGVTTNRWLRSGGLDIKYGLNESFTLDMTLIPDFSQVISDNVVRNLSPFEQQLNENRPFFTEGTELFNKADIFYSRRVGGRPTGYNSIQNIYGDHSKYIIEKNPNVTTLYNAFKISGRTSNNYGIGIFNAVGAPTHAKVKDRLTGETTKFETEPLTNYNVVVVDKALKGQSNINFTNTNVWRRGTASDANVSSLMLNKFNKKETYSLSAFSKFSILNNENYQLGSSVGLNIAKITGKLIFSASAIRISPKFDKSDMGIQFDYNHSVQNFNISYNENKPKSKLLQLYRIGLNQNVAENTVPFVFKYYEVGASAFFLFKNFWDVTISSESKPFSPIDFYQLGNFGLRLKTYPYWYNAIEGSSDSRKKLFWFYYVGYGISNEKHTEYVYLNQSLRYRFSPKLDISINGEVTRDNSNIGYAYYDDIVNEPVVGRRDVREYMGEISMKLNLNPFTNFTARFRHYNSFIRYTSFHHVDGLGEWRNRPVVHQNGYDENFNLQNIDIFFNWMFKPGSRVVVSYKQWLNDAYLLNTNTENTYFKNVHQFVKTPHAFELAVRVIYFLDYNTLRSSTKI